MQANPRTIDELFNSQLRYVVPMFQRVYVWQETPQWQTLWEDVTEKAALQLQGVKSNAHYLGALIIEGVRPTSPREVKRFLVIDGQQRLTTLQLMLCAFRDYCLLKGWKAVERTLSRYLENADADVMERPDEEVHKLWPTTLNRKVFIDVMTARSSEEVERRYPLVYLKRRRKPEPRSNLVEAYLFFERSIARWATVNAALSGRTEEDCAFTLLQALKQDFCVVEITLSEGDDSQEIFYSLNSQGRPLSQSDLLRSLIFMRAEKERADRDKIFSEYWSRFETDFGSQEIKRAGRTYSRLDLGLRYFLMAKKATVVDARRVNEEYRSWISENPPRYDSVRSELADFSAHCALLESYEDPAAGALPCTDFRRVLRELDVSTAIPLVMHLNLNAGLTAQQLDRCVSLLQSFVVRRAITGEENKEYNILFVDIVATLKGLAPHEVESGLTRKLLSGGGATRRWPTDEQVIEAAISRPIFQELRQPVLRLILERLEFAARSKKTEDTSIPTGLQIEHVLPQRWGAHWTLDGKAIPQTVVGAPYLANGEIAALQEAIRARNSKLHTLGNLTLLNEYLNPAASNGSLEMKRVEYKNSVLRLNRYFDSVVSWDEEAITKRGRLLGDEIVRIWARPAHESAAAAREAATA